MVVSTSSKIALNKYDQIIQGQLKKEVIEKADQEPTGKVFYISHKPVIKEAAGSTKIRIVYDASVRENDVNASLNEYLETGPKLQNLLLNIVLRNRLIPIALTGDLKQVFLPITIQEKDRYSLILHWIKEKNSSNSQQYLAWFRDYRASRWKKVNSH